MPTAAPPAYAPRPGRAHHTYPRDSRAGGEFTSPHRPPPHTPQHTPPPVRPPVPRTTPCFDDPPGWEVSLRRRPEDTAAAIRAAAVGCAACFRTHRAAHDACAATPRGRRSPLTVMAGLVVTTSGLLVHPGRFIRAFLPRLAAQAAQAAHDPDTPDTDEQVPA